MQHPYDALDLAQLRRRTSMKWSAYGADVIPMWVAETDFPLAEPIRNVLHELIERGDTGYPSGTAHVEAFARFAARRYGWQLDPSTAFTVPDVMTGVEQAIGTLTERGDGVVFLTPAYPPFFLAVTSSQRRVVAAPMAVDGDSWSIDGDAIEHGLRGGAKAILLCNPHNPTGRRFGRDELTTVAALADHHGVPVISDEIHAPLLLDRAAGEHVPFPTLDAESAARCVCLHSASKGWNLPGLKAAVMVVGGPTRQRFDAEVLDELAERSGILGVAAGAAAFDEGEPWLDDTIAYVAGNHALVREELPGVRIARAQATYLAWLDLRKSVPGEPADVLLDKARVALVPGPRFGARYAGWARMNLGTSRPIVREALARIAAVLR